MESDKIAGVIEATSAGVLRRQVAKENDVLPSINELSFEFEISRDTAEKGYKHLKKTGVLGSVPGKGYFVKNAEALAIAYPAETTGDLWAILEGAIVGDDF